MVWTIGSNSGSEGRKTLTPRESRTMAAINQLSNEQHIAFSYKGSDRVGTIESISDNNVILLRYDTPQLSRGKMATHSNFTFSKISDLIIS
jgi:hypothetical protein